jgi:hypothetical protein
MEEFSLWFFSAQGAVTLFVSILWVLTVISVLEIRKDHKLSNRNKWIEEK